MGRGKEGCCPGAWRERRSSGYTASDSGPQHGGRARFCCVKPPRCADPLQRPRECTVFQPQPLWLTVPHAPSLSRFSHAGFLAGPSSFPSPSLTVSPTLTFKSDSSRTTLGHLLRPQTPSFHFPESLSQTEKDRHCMVSLVCGIRKNMTNE